MLTPIKSDMLKAIQEGYNTTVMLSAIFSITLNGIRYQVATLVDKGYVEKFAPYTRAPFRLTEKGKVYAKTHKDSLG